MEGPTPVSALIHAATMVTAGVFLVAKCAFIFEYGRKILIIISIIGGITAFIAGTIGAVQTDIKKIIAYSTCSQLGYMILSCGLSNYILAIFHLSNHAFFKALLFLAAGSIIHIMNNEQDIRKMGTLAKIFPSIYMNVFIASLALAGFPFLAGFYSKDLIIESSNTQL
jgi:NADH-ubiquinone oxidoreductase chain 5